MKSQDQLKPINLPAGILERYIPGINGLTVHILDGGFQGALNWYRCNTNGLNRSDIELFSNHTIDVPSCFISGIADWARFRPPGALELMQQKACTNLQSFHIIEGAGHWIQQEQPESLTQLMLDFLENLK